MNPLQASRLGIAILAGGRSRRMGEDKAWALLDGQPLIAHVIARMQPLAATSRMLVVTREPARCAALGIEARADIIPDQGPLGGLHTALHTLQSESVVLVGCDLPYASAAIFARLIAEQTRAGVPYAAVVPRFQGQPQPLHALYHHSALPTVEHHLAGGQLRMLDLVDALSVRLLDEADYPAGEAERAFLNLNTPDALAAAQSKR